MTPEREADDGGRLLPRSTGQDDPPVFVVVGHVNKGKSSIVSTLSEDDSVRVARDPGTTRASRPFDVVVDGKTLYTIIDTPGFEQPRHVLAWLQERENSAASRPELVQRFVEEHRRDPEFEEECELLGPLMDGAGILYVVDGSQPFRPRYEAEMEILKWTGQPRMALINRIGEGDHTGEWSRALDQYFNIARDFDAHAASFEERVRLLRSFAQLRESWRAPLERAIEVLEVERRRRLRETSRQITSLLVDCLTHRLEVKIGEGEVVEPERTEELARRFHDELRTRENRARDDIEALYAHSRLERVEDSFDAPLLNRDLFADEVWKVFGLSEGELKRYSAITGAVVGAGIDIAAGGFSGFLGTAVGAATGFLAAHFSKEPLMRVQVVGQRVGGRVLKIGPHRSPNFPWVLLDRALLHHRAVSDRSHARRGALELTTPAGSEPSSLVGVSVALRTELTTCFAKLSRAARPSDSVVARLRKAIDQVLEVEPSADSE